MLHEKVNIVPVIGKADSLTKNEIAKLKKKVWHFGTLIGFNIFYLNSQFLDKRCGINQPSNPVVEVQGCLILIPELDFLPHDINIFAHHLIEN